LEVQIFPVYNPFNLVCEAPFAACTFLISTCPILILEDFFEPFDRCSRNLKFESIHSFVDLETHKG
jgi:hypothetical protein